MKAILLAGFIALTSSVSAAESESCFAMVATNETLSPLGSKIALTGLSKPTVDMLTNSAKPTRPERVLIRHWMTQLESCMKNNPAYNMDGQPPHIANLFQSQILDFFTTTADLHAGKATYGQYAKTMAKSSSEFLEKLQAINTANESRREAEAAQEAQEIERRQDMARHQHQLRVQQAQAQEEMRRQAALNMLMQQRQQPTFQAQPYQMPVRPTVTTNCQQIGTQLHCTSH